MTDKHSALRSGQFVPTFDGKAADFQIWWTQFKASASVEGFFEVAEPKARLPRLQQTRKVTGKLLRRKRNTKPMANLTIGIQTDALMGLVYKAINEDWPAGQECSP